jgi:hypothetical protein
VPESVTRLRTDGEGRQTDRDTIPIPFADAAAIARMWREFDIALAGDVLRADRALRAARDARVVAFARHALDEVSAVADALFDLHVAVQERAATAPVAPQTWFATVRRTYEWSSVASGRVEESVAAHGDDATRFIEFIAPLLAESAVFVTDLLLPLMATAIQFHLFTDPPLAEAIARVRDAVLAAAIALDLG